MRSDAEKERRLSEDAAFDEISVESLKSGLNALSSTLLSLDGEALRVAAEVVDRISELIEGQIVRGRHISAARPPLVPPLEHISTYSNVEGKVTIDEIVVDTIAELTQYPREILLPSADLEEELGIDSVKRGEIASTLERRLGIARGTSAPAGPAPRTISDVIAMCVQLLGRNSETQSVLSTTVAADPAKRHGEDNGSRAVRADLDEIVVDTIAELTQYPREILLPSADLEEELGIDSVKRGEIASTLERRLGIARGTSAPAGPAPRTISDVIAMCVQLLGRNSETQSVLSTTVAADPAKRHGEDNGSRAVRVDIDKIMLHSTTQAMQDSPARLAPEAVSRVTRGFSLEERPRMDTEIDGREILAANASSGMAESIGIESTFALDTRDTHAKTHLNGTATMYPFTGKLAFVTGSGHGLGKAIASQLAVMGATVIVNSFYSRERGDATTAEINAKGGNAFHVWGSVANHSHVVRMFAEIEKQFGALDFFVQNASNGIIAPLSQVTATHWDKAFRTNVVALHEGAFLAAKLMRPRGGGRIVSLSSPGAQRYLEYFGCLGPVKAAVESLTVYLSVELAPYNVQVNSVSAGPVYGERLSAYPDSKRLIPYWENLSADGRLGDPEDITNAVLYLLSPSSRKINGTVLLVDGAASQRM